MPSAIIPSAINFWKDCHFAALWISREYFCYYSIHPWRPWNFQNSINSHIFEAGDTFQQKSFLVSVRQFFLGSLKQKTWCSPRPLGGGHLSGYRAGASCVCVLGGYSEVSWFQGAFLDYQKIWITIWMQTFLVAQDTCLNGQEISIRSESQSFPHLNLSDLIDPT